MMIAARTAEETFIEVPSGAHRNNRSTLDRSGIRRDVRTVARTYVAEWATRIAHLVVASFARVMSWCAFRELLRRAPFLQPTACVTTDIVAEEADRGDVASINPPIVLLVSRLIAMKLDR
jgi:hypothetical protein